MTQNLVSMFPIRLRAARKARGMSTKDLGASCGVSYQAISSYELDRRCPSLETALLLMDALDCPMEWLFERKTPEEAAAEEEEKLPWEV